MNGYSRYFPIGAPGSAPAISHIHTVDEALAMVEAAKHYPRTEYDHVTFHNDAVLMLQQNPGHAGIRVQEGFNGHHHSLILFSVDAEGKLITGPGIVAVENGQVCPPEC